MLSFTKGAICEKHFKLAKEVLCWQTKIEKSFVYNFIVPVRVFAHGAMGLRIDPSWWTH